MDIDGNGKVHWNEFLSAIISQTIIMRAENLREAFNFFDRDSKGYFTSSDFKSAIVDPYLSFGGAYQNLEHVIEEAFPGIDKVRYDDFWNFMMKQNDNGRYSRE